MSYHTHNTFINPPQTTAWSYSGNLVEFYRKSLNMKLFAAIVACLVLLSSVSVEARGKDPKDCEGAEIEASWRRVIEC